MKIDLDGEWGKPKTDYKLRFFRIHVPGYNDSFERDELDGRIVQAESLQDALEGMAMLYDVRDAPYALQGQEPVKAHVLDGSGHILSTWLLSAEVSVTYSAVREARERR